jgi:heterotetrameric sarcosine oxidase gamma subunit
VAELSWHQTTPLGKAAGRYGVKTGAAGVNLTEFRDFELVQVMARRGQWTSLAAAATERFGAAPPEKPEALGVGGVTLIWSGPDQFLALRPRMGEGSLLDMARQAFAAAASMSEQSDGRALLRLAGPKARATLAKCCSLDLHPRSFAIGQAAATSIDHTAVGLWRAEDGADGMPVFLLLLFSSFAASLLRTIIDAGAEYGVDIAASEAWQP